MPPTLEKFWIYKRASVATKNATLTWDNTTSIQCLQEAKLQIPRTELSLTASRLPNFLELSYFVIVIIATAGLVSNLVYMEVSPIIDYAMIHEKLVIVGSIVFRFGRVPAKFSWAYALL